MEINIKIKTNSKNYSKDYSKNYKAIKILNKNLNKKLNKKIIEKEETKMEMFNYYVKQKMNNGHTEFHSILMFLNDPDIPNKYKDEYYKLVNSNVVPMDIDDDLGPPPAENPRLTRQDAYIK